MSTPPSHARVPRRSAGALVLVARRIDALRDVRRLAVQVIVEIGGLPVESFLLVADAANDLAGDAFDLVAGAGRPAVRVLEPAFIIDRRAADLAADDDPLGGHQRFAGNPRFRVLADEIIDQCVADLVGDLVGMAFGHRLRGEEVVAAHE